jgi:hypothetical protein
LERAIEASTRSTIYRRKSSKSSTTEFFGVSFVYLEAIFNYARIEQIEFFFTAEAIYISRSDSKKSMELGVKLKIVYANDCYNFNRNVQVYRDGLYYVDEYKTLSKLCLNAEFFSTGKLSIDRVIERVDTFKLNGKNIFSLTEDGNLSRHHLFTNICTKAKLLSSLQQNSWFTTIEAFDNSVIVTCLDKEFKPKSKNMVFLFSTDLKLMHRVCLVSESLKQRKQKTHYYANPIHLVKRIQYHKIDILILSNLIYSLSVLAINHNKMHIVVESFKLHDGMRRSRRIESWLLLPAKFERDLFL